MIDIDPNHINITDWTTMLFPITGAEIPSEDWKTLKVTPYPMQTFLTHQGFTADILHVPTGFHLVVDTTENPNEYGWKAYHPDREDGGSEEQKQEILSLWSELVAACIPVAQQQAKKYGIDDGDIYTEPHLSNFVMEIFVIEYQMAEKFSRSEYLVVWDDVKNTYTITKTRIPFALREEGLEGLYWNRESRDWVRI